MHRKTPILGPRSSVTPDTIDLKFGTRNYIVDTTQHAKNYNNRPAGAPGNGVKYHVQVFLPARRYASAGLCDSDVSVCLSVRLSVRRTPVLCLAERKQDREMYTI